MNLQPALQVCIQIIETVINILYPEMNTSLLHKEELHLKQKLCMFCALEI